MNVVLIDCHDLGDWLGCYDRPWLTTPHLDRLAADGARCTAHFATAPQCMPSRGGIYTGCLPHRAGVTQQNPLADEARCLGRHLADAGWRTVLAGHLNILNDPTWAGFAETTPLPRDAAEAEGLVAALAGDRPCFLHVSHGLVHRPYGQAYDPAVAASLAVPPILPDTDTTRRDLASLAANVAELDRQVGLVLDAIDATGAADGTLVIFTTDHGVALAHHKHTLYDGGLRTALVMRLPGTIAPGSVHDELLSNVDLFPTVCELAGVPVPADLDGMSFAGLLRDGPAPARRAAFAEVNWTRRSGRLCYVAARCLRTATHKLIRNDTPEPCYLDGGFVGRFAGDLATVEAWPRFARPSPGRELYDCAADPWEQRNLAGDPAHADLLAELDAELDRVMAATGDPLLAGPVPSATDEPVKPQWVADADGRYRLDFDLPSETRERPFGAADALQR